MNDHDTSPGNSSRFPSFSLVVETENLSVAGVKELSCCLNSLALQDVPPGEANEVLLIESGDVPEAALQQICRSYPWISLHRVNKETGYYEAKMEGFSLTTGEVVVFCDSDCVYEPGWLKNLLMPFGKGDVSIIGGETSLRISGPYALAMALSWYMPPFSNRPGLYATSGYACNNVAFRSAFLREHPIPCHLGWYRGNCTLHAIDLREKGFTIWKQPRSRGIHPLVKRSHFVWRFMLAAHHELMAYRTSAELNTGRPWVDFMFLTFISMPKIAAKRLARPLVRLSDLVRQDPRNLAHLPLALPWLLVSAVAFFLGLGLSFIRPTFFKRTWGLDLRDGNA